MILENQTGNYQSDDVEDFDETNCESAVKTLQSKILRAKAGAAVNAAPAKHPAIVETKAYKPLYPSIKLQDGYIGYYEGSRENKVFNRIARNIQVTAVKRNIETSELSYSVRFKSLNGYVEDDLKRSELTKAKIARLAALGADVFEHNVTNIIKHLRNEEQKAPVKNVHSQVGWGLLDGTDIFKCSRAVGTESDYVGDLAIEQKGSLDGWKELVKNEVIGSTPLEAALVFGLSSILVGYIGYEISLDCLPYTFTATAPKARPLRASWLCRPLATQTVSGTA